MGKQGVGVSYLSVSPSSQADSPTAPALCRFPLQPPAGLTSSFPSHVHLPTKPYMCTHTHAHTHTHTHVHMYQNIGSVSRGQAHWGLWAVEGEEKTLNKRGWMSRHWCETSAPGRSLKLIPFPSPLALGVGGRGGQGRGGGE